MKSIDQFIDILNEQLILNENLLNISIEKKDVIMQNDSKRLNQMAHEEQNIVKKIISLEKLRGAVVSNLERELNIEKIENIKDVIKKIEEEKAREVENIASRLKEVLLTLEEKNDLNNKLLQISLEYLELNLNLLTSQPEPKTYGKKAAEQYSENTSFFDAKY